MTNLPPVARSLLELLDQRIEISRSEAAVALSTSQASATRHLRTLVTEGYAEAVGQGRALRYRRIYRKESRQSIAVLKGGELAGRLSYDDADSFFEYDKRFKGELDGLPKGQDELVCTGELFPVFENLLPEGDARDRFLSVQKPRHLAEFLTFLSSWPGEWQFVPYADLSALIYKKQPALSWLKFKPQILGAPWGEDRFPLVLTQRIDISEADLFVLEDGVKKGLRPAGLSGFQIKLPIEITPDAIRRYEGDQDGYFLKPYNPERSHFVFQDKDRHYIPYLAVNEHLFMSFAKYGLGFDVPWTALVKDATSHEYHLVIKRYDRFVDKDGAWRVIGQRDFCQIFNLPSSEKYNLSTEKLFEKAKTLLAEGEMLKLLVFYYYSFLICHGDLHLKNISLFEGQSAAGKGLLTPWYDVSTTAIYKGLSNHEIGLVLAGKKSGLGLENFLDLAERVGVDVLRFKDEARRVTRAFVGQFPAYIDRLGMLGELPFAHSRYKTKTLKGQLEQFYAARMKALADRKILIDLKL